MEEELNILKAESNREKQINSILINRIQSLVGAASSSSRISGEQQNNQNIYNNYLRYQQCQY